MVVKEGPDDTARALAAFLGSSSRKVVNLPDAAGQDSMWAFHDVGSATEAHPLVILPGIIGARGFFRLLPILSRSGRVIAVDPPAVASRAEFVERFHQFLGTVVGDDGVHLFGTGLGGFLAQCYAADAPGRVRSLFLCASCVRAPRLRGRLWADAFWVLRCGCAFRAFYP